MTPAASAKAKAYRAKEKARLAARRANPLRRAMVEAKRRAYALSLEREGMPRHIAEARAADAYRIVS